MRIGASLVLAATGMLWLGPAAVAALADSATTCGDLATLKLPDTAITVAEVVPPGAFASPGEGQPRAPFDRLPAFCRVAATVSPVPDSVIRFELWMPEEKWNGKFVGTGNGGLAGAIFYDFMADPLARGYAVANTDTGHEGGGADASFAIGHPEKLIDHAWRAVHEMTVKSKQIIEARFAKPPRLSYWTGCSSGGRQGLKEAQRFPGDYDGIHAAAPAANWVPLLSHAVMIQQALTRADGGLPVEKLPLLAEAAVAACDARDGVTDRVVQQPQACGFDPAALACDGANTAGCLLPGEIDAARTIYRGLVHPETGDQLAPGPEPGSELQWQAFTPGAFPIGVNYWRDVIVGDPDWDPSMLDFAAIDRAIADDRAGISATDPGISEFIEGGGKLLLWHGWIDGLVPPQNTIDYFEDVRKTLGPDRTDDAVRLFMAPGVEHCGGGDGPADVDALAALEAWVEEGIAPERLLARKQRADGSTQARPLCAYPEVAVYDGSGDPDSAASFRCRLPVVR